MYFFDFLYVFCLLFVTYSLFLRLIRPITFNFLTLFLFGKAAKLYNKPQDFFFHFEGMSKGALYDAGTETFTDIRNNSMLYYADIAEAANTHLANSANNTETWVK